MYAHLLGSAFGRQFDPFEPYDGLWHHAGQTSIAKSSNLARQHYHNYQLMITKARNIFAAHFNQKNSPDPVRNQSY